MRKFHTVYNIKQRLIAVVLAIAFVLFLLVLRLFFVTVVSSKELQAKALDQWTRDLPLIAKRGDIVDCNGIKIATTNTLYDVYLRGRSIEHKEQTAKSLSEILQMNYEEVFKKVCKTNVSEVTLKRKVERTVVDKIISQNIEGVYFSQDIMRVYPYNNILSQVLGFMSTDNTGQSGLELYYDKFLKGVDGKSLTETDIRGIELNSGTPTYLPSIAGLDVKLTIDLKIQQICENVLSTAMISHSPKSASVIVMNPQNGEIVAMASQPSFDLNNPPRDDLSTLMKDSRNSLVVDIYEPGSTFKVLTAAACLEEYEKGNKNAFSAKHIFSNNSNFREVDGQKIKCWTIHQNGKHCNQNLGMALNNSCNPIFMDIALSLGTDKFYDYIEAFGYGKATGIDFMGEGLGMLIPQTQVKNCDLARISFGQTIAVTPLQLISATTAAINGGVYVKPHLMKGIYASNGQTAHISPNGYVRRVVSENTSRQIASMLEEVVTVGSGKNAFIEGYKVGGKTGTAQKYQNGVIAQGKNIMSFTGFFPSNNPQYIALFIVDEPAGGGFGSTIAAPFVKMIFEQIIDYKKIRI